MRCVFRKSTLAHQPSVVHIQGCALGLLIPTSSRVPVHTPFHSVITATLEGRDRFYTLALQAPQLVSIRSGTQNQEVQLLDSTLQQKCLH